MHHPALYKDWKSVQIAEDGVFSVPKEWIVTQSDNLIYITDKPIDENYTILLTGMIGVNENSEDYFSFLSDFYGEEGKYSLAGSTTYASASLKRFEYRTMIQLKLILINELKK